MEFKYYNGDKLKGRIYDWNLVRKEYKKLGCPKGVYNPLKIPIEIAKWIMLLSERSTGKTTNLLLFGMVWAWLYNGVMGYIRKNDSMITKKGLESLFSTILEWGYVTKITGGRWNSIFYYASKFYYCNVDEDGNITEKASTPFMRCFALNARDSYKSSGGFETVDYVIFDEFIGDRYILNEFVHLCDLLKTLFRDRYSPVVFMLANTIDLHSEYFNEMEIYEDIQLIEVGTSQTITTEKGTNIYVELIKDAKEVTEKKKFNSLFFGFKNSRISSITGDGWAFSEYPHIEAGFHSIQHGIYIDYHGRFLELEIVEYPERGVFIIVHRANKPYDDSVIYSNSELKDKRYRFHLGDGSNLDKFIGYCIVNHRILFQDNSCGTIFFNHVNSK